MSVRRAIHGLLVTAAVLLFITSLWQILFTIGERIRCAEEYETVRERYLAETSFREGHRQEGDEGEGETDLFPDLQVDFAGLQAENPDIAAWIFYEDAAVSYPVLQEQEGEEGKYLHTTFQGEENPAGSIYLSAGEKPDFSAYNTFLYGHNMKNGEMFGRLKEIYRTPEKGKEPYFYLWLLSGEVVRYRVMAVSVVQADSAMYRVPERDDSARAYRKEALRLGRWEQPVPFSEEERTAMEEGSPMVTLSTCYGPANGDLRLLVQGIETARKRVMVRPSP